MRWCKAQDAISDKRSSVRLLFLLTLLLFGDSGSTAAATSPILAMTAGGVTMEFTAEELLSRPDAGRVAVPRDPFLCRGDELSGSTIAGIVGRTPARPGGYDPGACERRFVAEIPRALISGAAVP